MKLGEFFAELGFKIDGVQALDEAQKALETARDTAEGLIKEVDELTKASLEAEAATKLWEAGTKESNAAGARAAEINEELAVKKYKLKDAEKAVGEASEKVTRSHKSQYQNLQKLTGQAGRAAVAINAINVALVVLIKTASKAGLLLDKFNIQTGMSAQELQRWQYALEKAGASGDSMADTLRGLQDQQSQIAMGGGDISAFQFFGIDPRDNPLGVLEQLKDRLKDFTDANIGFARERAHAMGVSDDLFQALRRESFALDGLSKQLILTKEEQQNLSEASREWAAVLYKTEALKNKFFASFAPAVSMVAKGADWLVSKLSLVANWMAKGGVVATGIKWVLIALAAALGIVGVGLAAMTVLIGVLTTAVGLFILASSGLIAALLPITGTILLIGAAVGALILLIDDLVTDFEGGESVIGEFFKSFHEPVDALAAAIETVIALWDVLTGKFGSAKEHFKEAIKDIAPVFKISPTVLANSFGATPVLQPPQTFADMATRAATPSVSNVGGSTIRQENNIDVSIDGSAEPRETARQVGKTLKSEIGVASYQMPVANY